MEILTPQNAPQVAVIQNIAHPEWGTKRFTYNAQRLNNGESISIFGSGCNSACLPEDEFHLWQVISRK